MRRLLLIAVSALVAYTRFVRPWHMRWGATDQEVARTMPLDERVAHPASVSTRAITINVPPERVWPWVVQLGEPPRAGYYSYTWIERLVGLDIENSNRIIPEYQTLRAGDSLDKKGDMHVHAVEPGRYVVLGPPESVGWLRCTWAICLYPTGDGRTRLITRVRADWTLAGMLKNTPPPLWPIWLFIDPGVFVMERKMLTEIKRRAEHILVDAS